MLKMFLAAFVCLTVVGCISYVPQPCLAPNQQGKVITIRPGDRDNWTQIKVQTAHDTRVCGTNSGNIVTTLAPGDVLTGYEDETNEYRPGRWMRLR